MNSLDDNDVCQNCGKAADNTTICSGCKLACYCGETCQHSHWKDVHEEACRQFQTEKENAGNRRDFRLFRQWVDKASGALSVYCRFAAPGIENFDCTKHAFLVEVKFDFNQKNFRPVKAAEIVGVDPGTSSSFGTKANQRGDVVMAKIRYREFELEIPVFLTVEMRNDCTNEPFDGDYLDTYGELDLQHKVFNSIQLESSVFRKWANIEQENRHKSFRHLLSNEGFIQFMIHAYHLPCYEPRYTPADYVLAVTVSFGFTLGQMERTHNFFILPRKQAFEKLRYWYHLTPKAIKSLEKQCLVKTGEGKIDMAVILLAHVSRKLSVHHVQVSRWKILCKKKLQPIPCDQKAMALFEQVQAKPTLDMESPDLNEM